MELQPLFGSLNEGVGHILPRGDKNPTWFGGSVEDIYACYAQGEGTLRGAHYHLKLDEMFMTVRGTALWILSDMREQSPTYGQTASVVIGWDAFDTPDGVPTFLTSKTEKLARLRVPAGVWHAFVPLGEEHCLNIALGTTGHDAEDYRYPELSNIPQLKEHLDTFNVNLS